MPRPGVELRSLDGDRYFCLSSSRRASSSTCSASVRVAMFPPLSLVAAPVDPRTPAAVTLPPYDDPQRPDERTRDVGAQCQAGDMTTPGDNLALDGTPLSRTAASKAVDAI